MSTPVRLHQHTASMVALESKLNLALEKLSEQVVDHPDVFELFNQFRTISESQLQALQARLKDIVGEKDVPAGDVPEFELKIGNHPVSSALQHASAFLNYVIVGYAMLRSVALRYRDSSIIGDNNTGDMAEQHTKNYVNAVHEINRSLHNVVLWEMDKDGETCQCTCPSCGLGICMCAQGPRRTLSDIWLEPGPISNESDVFLHPPRPGSAADVAGLCHGDTIVAADDQKLESHFTLQQVVGAHESGEKIVLQIRRSSGELEEVSVVRP